MTARDAFIAVNRFGLGARPGELAKAAADPQGWVEAQLAGKPALPRLLRPFAGSRQTIAEFRETRRAAKKSKDKTQLKSMRKSLRRAFVMEAAARTQVQIETQQPVVERLVAFWSNHFTVSARKTQLAGIVGAYEREAIRPHVTGRFEDMLRAAIRHPAMLIYLDNAQSIGPNSRAGQRRNRGLNENLAREVLELHTLGVDGGYTQTDVREFAKMLTGWSIGRPRKGNAGKFAFYDRAHEPGSKLLLGRRYPEDGVGEADAALSVLARHPSTARHIAFKLARHYIADEPGEVVVKQLAKVFLDTDGDLRAVTLAVVRAKEAWTAPTPKVKTPNEFLVSTLRATGFEDTPKKLIGALRLMGRCRIPRRLPPAGPTRRQSG